MIRSSTRFSAGCLAAYQCRSCCLFFLGARHGLHQFFFNRALPEGLPWEWLGAAVLSSSSSRLLFVTFLLAILPLGGTVFTITSPSLDDPACWREKTVIQRFVRWLAETVSHACASLGTAQCRRDCVGLLALWLWGSVGTGAFLNALGRKVVLRSPFEGCFSRDIWSRVAAMHSHAHAEVLRDRWESSSLPLLEETPA